MSKLLKIFNILALLTVSAGSLVLSSFAQVQHPDSYTPQHPSSYNWQAGRPEFRGLTPREFRPYGQMRGDIQYKIAKFRLTRTQEERRPRDARAVGPQNLGPVGQARPEIVDLMNLNQTKGFGGGWFWEEGNKGGANYAEGWTPTSDEPIDMANIHMENEGNRTQWWEEKVRGQGQRGGWFRARFGGGGGGGARGGGAGGVSAMQEGGVTGLTGAQGGEAEGGGVQGLMDSMETGAAGADQMGGAAPQGGGPDTALPGGVTTGGSAPE